MFEHTEDMNPHAPNETLKQYNKQYLIETSLLHPWIPHAVSAVLNRLKC